MVELLFLETNLLVVERPYLLLKWICFASSLLNLSISWNSPSLLPIILIIGGQLFSNILRYYYQK